MAEAMMDKLNRLAKWRMWLAGWQLGTRAKTDPEAEAVRNHREVTLMLRAETTALVWLLVEKGVFTLEEWEARLGIEADELSASLSRQFPGVTATDDGLHLNVAVMQEHGTGAHWKP